LTIRHICLSLCLCLAVLLIPLASIKAANAPAPYEVSYTAKYNGMAVDAKRELKKTEQGYRIVSSVKGMLGGMTEQEDFQIDSHGSIRTDHYLAKKSFFGIKSTEELVIDQEAGKASYTRKRKRKELLLKDGYLGPVSYQLQLRNDLKTNIESTDEKPASNTFPLKNSLSYKVMSRGRIKDYQFEILGEEIVNTTLGEIPTLKVQRIRKDAKRQTIFWIAPAWNYLMVKISQQEKGGEHYEMLLDKASIDGNPIRLAE
jgi:uncharacterized protein DUF3108